MSDPEPEVVTDEQRLPLLTPQGRALLEQLREHPAAPRFSARSGNRLTAPSLEKVRAFAADCAGPGPAWPPGGQPEWVRPFARQCVSDVPFYRRYGELPAAWDDVPTCGRADLARDPCAWVPDSVPAAGLIKYTTSGTTGHPLLVPSHPVVAGCYVPLLQRALGWHDVRLASRRGQVACVLIGLQPSCFTYVSVTPLLDDAGFVKINLHPNDWRDPADRARYLDACAPEIITGDPVSFACLADLPMAHQPRALISTSMTLLPGLRNKLAARFKCPVVDVYALNEAGPVAAALPGGGYGLLQPRLFVEILDDAGRPCPPGTSGEMVLTGGINFCLPLLRYRTGDQAALAWRDGRPVLLDLEGRPPTVFIGQDGRRINNIEITHALAPFALAQYQLHQAAGGAFHLRVLAPCFTAEAVRAAVLGVLGRDQRLTVELADDLGVKVIQYTTDLPDAAP